MNHALLQPLAFPFGFGDEFLELLLFSFIERWWVLLLESLSVLFSLLLAIVAEIDWVDDIRRLLLYHAVKVTLVVIFLLLLSIM
ncbi:MAG: hypothetical protein JST59_01360 [Actinobacteria bacterium]|nr:hypothetical protein [Actinomycetota bacterium]